MAVELINSQKNLGSDDKNDFSNYDAEISKDTITIKENLKNQMANKVNWTKSI